MLRDLRSHESAEHLSGVAIPLLEKGGVHLQGHSGVGMPQSARDCPDVHAGSDGVSGRKMAKVLESHLHSCQTGHPFECVCV